MTLSYYMTGLVSCLLLACTGVATAGGAGGSRVAGMTATDRLLRGQQKFECSGRVIGVGLPRADVLAACGPPTWQDQRTDSWVDGIGPDGTVLVSVFTEEWIFDFGPDRLLHFVYFRDGKVAGIRTGGYGGRGSDCGDGDNLAIGDSKLEVFQKCGAPVRVGRGKGGEKELTDPDTVVRRILDSDYWTYDFGPSRFVRMLTFQNGRLKSIERGGYGR